MLWNPRLKEKTFRAIVSRFRDRVDAVSLEDCYHRHEARCPELFLPWKKAYFHVVPTTWGLSDRDSVEHFSSEAGPLTSLT